MSQSLSSLSWELIGPSQTCTCSLDACLRQCAHAPAHDSYLIIFSSELYFFLLLQLQKASINWSCDLISAVLQETLVKQWLLPFVKEKQISHPSQTNRARDSFSFTLLSGCQSFMTHWKPFSLFLLSFMMTNTVFVFEEHLWLKELLMMIISVSFIWWSIRSSLRVITSSVSVCRCRAVWSTGTSCSERLCRIESSAYQRAAYVSWPCPLWPPTHTRLPWWPLTSGGWCSTAPVTVERRGECVLLEFVF